MEPAPYGTWRSPIAAADLARSAIGLAYLDVADGTPYWVESRPASQGRNVIVSVAPDGVRECTPERFNVRSRVHEYGGKPYFVHGGDVFFANFADQRLYVQSANGPAIAITPEGYRYADFDLGSSANTLFCVREDHSRAGEPANAIVALDVGGATRAQHTAPSAGRVLYDRSDFVAYPRVSPDGRRLAWIAWNHPDMPWDATTLYVADLAQGGLSSVTPVAAGSRESVVEPRWGDDGSLYFISDRSGWWNLYRWKAGLTHSVFAMAAELASPLWTLGQANYVLAGNGRAVVRYSVNGMDRLAIVDLASGELDAIPLPYVSLSSIALLTPTTAVVIASSAAEEAAIVAIDLEGGQHRVVRAPGKSSVDPRYLSVGEPIQFVNPRGVTVHAFFYPPVNADFTAPSGARPPLIVKAHGGPTSQSTPAFSLATQFWTSRGFAVLDVNYGGSSGYGRSYRERLEGQWGIVDVEDVVAGAVHLAATDRIDPEHTAIRGGSAGGFTVLAALAFHDAFKAGANYYGVSDLEALAHDTHKFESRYLDRLVAPLPEGRSVYEARAPIRHLENFQAPLITFQGAEDQVVPPSQSRAIVAALERRGVHVAYIEFEGEQHGFRQAESIERSLSAELAFYGEVFGFSPAA